jgi:group I intron endonuclease
MLIYRVTNTVNGKVYIGKWSHPTPDHRWRLHKSAAKSGSPYYFHRAIRKYGSDAFKVEVIDRAKTPEELSEMEKQYIASYQSNDPEKGYNMTLGGEGHNGWKASEAWKQWKSGHSKKFWADPVYRAKQTKSHQEWWTPERRKVNAEQLQLRRASGNDPRKGTGKGPGTGKKHSVETRALLSALKNKPVRCLGTNEVFPSLTHAVERLGGCTTNLSRAIRHNGRFFGKRFEYAQ